MDLQVQVVKYVSSFHIQLIYLIIFLILAICPKGDDSLTPTVGYTVVNMTISALWGQLEGGTYLFSFNGQSFIFPADPTYWTQDDCKTSFNSLINIQNVNCTKSTGSNLSGGATYIVTFLSFPFVSQDNNIFTYNGTADASQFKCFSLSQTETSQGLQCHINIVSTATTITTPGILLKAKFFSCLMSFFI